jgi:O-antigen/teichoic acid export membrane protein
MYGLWMLLTAVAGLGVVISSGNGAATIKLVSEAIGRSDTQKVSRTVSTGIAVAFVAGAAFAAIVMLCFSLAGPYLFPRMGDPGWILVTGCVAAAIVVAEQADGIFSAALKGAEAFGAIARLEVVTRTMQMAALLAAVLLSAGLPGVYSILLMVALARLAAKAYVVRCVLGLRFSAPSRSSVAEFVALSKWGWVQGLGAILFNSADRFLVGSILGASALSHYAVILMLPQQIHSLSAAAASSVFPRVSRDNARNRAQESVRQLWRPFLALTTFCIVSAVALIVFRNQIFAIWLHKSLPTDALNSFVWLVTAYALLALNTLPHFALLGLGHIRYIAIVNVVAGGVALAALLATTNAHGLTGVGLTRLLYAIVALAAVIPILYAARTRQP